MQEKGADAVAAGASADCNRAQQSAVQLKDYLDRLEKVPKPEAITAAAKTHPQVKILPSKPRENPQSNRPPFPPRWPTPACNQSYRSRRGSSNWMTYSGKS